LENDIKRINLRAKAVVNKGKNASHRDNPKTTDNNLGKKPKEIMLHDPLKRVHIDNEAGIVENIGSK